MYLELYMFVERFQHRAVDVFYKLPRRIDCVLLQVLDGRTRGVYKSRVCAQRELFIGTEK